MIDTNHSSGMNPIRTFPGCSRRTGRSKPGVEVEVPLTNATAVVFWAIRGKKLNNIQRKFFKLIVNMCIVNL